MATKSEVEFPSKKGWYTLSELKHLSNSLGFDSSVFTKVIFSETKCLGTKGLSEKKFIEMLNLKMFDKYLDSTFNNKPAKYNVRTIKKALQLIRHRVIGFPELSQARMAYFLYENDDQLGMDADSSTILKALRLCDRVMSPVQLDKYLIDISLSVQIPCRLQLFEFLEMISLTMRIDSIPTARVADDNTEQDDYFQVIQTKEQKAMDILDKQFRASQPMTKVVKDKQKMPIAVSRQSSLVQNTEYDSVVSVAQDQAADLLSSVEISTAHLHSARFGHSFSPSEHDDTRSRVSTSLSFTHLANQMSQHQSLKYQFRKLPLREMWGHQKDLSSFCDDKCLEWTQGHSQKLLGQKCLQQPTAHARHAKAATETPIASSKLHSKPWQNSKSSNKRITRKVYPNTSTQQCPTPCQTPLITKDEFNKQQYMIDDLKWDMLRKETKSAKLKQFTSPSSVSVPHVKLHCDKDKQHYKFATLPLTDTHTLSLSVLEELNKNEKHGQKPTTHSLSRSKSVTFTLNGLLK